MAVSKSTPAPLVPRFVRNLNALAEQHGMKTSTEIDGYEGNESARVLWSVWEGTEAQLRATNLFKPNFHIRPTRTRFDVPPSSPCELPIVTGSILRGEGDLLKVECDFGPPPKAIANKGDVEIVEYDDAVVYHGTREALLGERLCSDFPGVRGTVGTSLSDRGRRWRTRRHPDGTYVHWVEREDVWQQRVQKHKEELAKDERVCRAADQGRREEAKFHEDRGPEGVLKALADFIWRFNHGAFAAHSERRTTSGTVYRLGDDAREAFCEIMSDCYWRLRELPVSVSKLDLRTPEQRQSDRLLATLASSDVQFQRFLGALRQNA